MRYFVLLGLGFLVWGCDKPYSPCGDSNSPPRTKDLIAVGIVETTNGELRVLAQEVDRWESVVPVALDCSPAYDPQYRFETKTLKLESGGRYYSSIGGGDDELGMSLSYVQVADGFLSAGVNFSDCDRTGASLPIISVRNEYHELIRFAQLSCEYSYWHLSSWSEMHVLPVRVIELNNGNLLYWGRGSTGQTRLTNVTRYGEVSWSQEFVGEDIYSTSVTGLRLGGFAMVQQQNDIVRFYDDNGVHVRNIEFNGTDEMRVTSVVQLANGNFVCGGVNMTSNDPHLWYYNSDAVEVRDTTLYAENCQDSVVLYPVGDNILLAGNNGLVCNGAGTVRLMLLDSLFNTIGVESFGGNTHVVLKDVTVGADGSIFLCGAYDRGIGSYSVLVTKYNENLDAIWSTTVHPN